MNRRYLLKQMLVLGAGAALLPSCMNRDESVASIPLQHLKVNGSGEKLLAELCETLLPATDTPGAKDLYLHHFVLNMMDACSSPDDQRAFENGLKAFDEHARKTAGNNFVQLSTAQRTALLQAMDAQKEATDEATKLFQHVKGLAIQGYLSSKFYMTKVHVYELVPGRYHGCVPVAATKQQKAA